MSPSRVTAPRSGKSFLLRGISLVMLALVAAYVVVNYRCIAAQASKDETRPADVIVVFGAAEYAGRPSPVYRARLDHGRTLFQRGVAPFIITTGGKGEDPKFTEGGVGRDYLVASGVPDARVIAETQSDDTRESAQRVATIMRANNMKTCVAVSDGYHLYRIKRMMAREGIEAYGSPRPGKVLTARQRSLFFLREVLSITLWRLHIT